MTTDRVTDRVTGPAGERATRSRGGTLSLDDLLAPAPVGARRRGLGTAGSLLIVGLGLVVAVGLVTGVLFALLPGSTGGPTGGSGAAAGAAGGSGASGSAAGAGASAAGTKAGAGSAAALPTLTGTFTLWSSKPQRNACAAHPQVPDIAPAAPVLVTDTGGTVLARSTLAAGRVESTRRGCVYPFTLAGLPRADGYQVKVGRQSALTYPAADLAAAGWRVQLNLGLPAPPTAPKPGPAKTSTSTGGNG
jgi:hypothetical protein